MKTPFPSFTKTWHTTTYPAIDPTSPSNSQEGKNIIITGGGSGIGARTARSFAEAGAAYVAVLGRREHALRSTIEALEKDFPNVKFLAYPVDITNKERVDEVFKVFVSVAGKIDVLVSNAGVGEVGDLIKDVDAATWLSGLDVNIKGALFVTQAFLRSCKEDAVLLNVSSFAAFVFGSNLSAYCVSKAAAARFFAIVSMENPGIRVISIHPGVVETAMSTKSGVPPLDDVSLPANFVVWTAGTNAGFLNGKYVFVNWDVDELKAQEKEIREKKLLEAWLLGIDQHFEARFF